MVSILKSLYAKSILIFAFFISACAVILIALRGDNPVNVVSGAVIFTASVILSRFLWYVLWELILGAYRYEVTKTKFFEIVAWGYLPLMFMGLAISFDDKSIWVFTIYTFFSLLILDTMVIHTLYFLVSQEYSAENLYTQVVKPRDSFAFIRTLGEAKNESQRYLNYKKPISQESIEYFNLEIDGRKTRVREYVFWAGYVDYVNYIMLLHKDILNLSDEDTVETYSNHRHLAQAYRYLHDAENHWESGHESIKADDEAIRHAYAFIRSKAQRLEDPINKIKIPVLRSHISKDLELRRECFENAKTKVASLAPQLSDVLLQGRQQKSSIVEPIIMYSAALDNLLSDIDDNLTEAEKQLLLVSRNVSDEQRIKIFKSAYIAQDAEVALWILFFKLQEFLKEWEKSVDAPAHIEESSSHLAHYLFDFAQDHENRFFKKYFDSRIQEISNYAKSLESEEFYAVADHFLEWVMRIYQGFPIPMPQDIKDIFEQTLISIIQKIAERLLIETRMYAPLGYLSLQPEDIKECAQLQRIQDLLETEHESTTRVLEDRQEALRLVRASHEWAQETGKYLYPELSGRLDAQDFVLEAQRYAVPTTVGVFSVNAVLKKLQELDQKESEKTGSGRTYWFPVQNVLTHGTYANSATPETSGWDVDPWQYSWGSWYGDGFTPADNSSSDSGISFSGGDGGSFDGGGGGFGGGDGGSF